MEAIVYLLKYGFIVALAVEGVLIGRALFRLATEKARAASQPSVAPGAAPAEGE